MFGRYWDRVDVERAIETHRESIRLNEEGREERGAALAAFFLGRALGAHGDGGQALATLRDARARFEDLPEKDVRMAARAEAAIGLVLDADGRTAEAVPHLRRAADALQAGRAYSYEAEARIALADIAARPGGDRSQLVADLTRARDIHRSMGSPQAVVDQLEERLRNAADEG